MIRVIARARAVPADSVLPGAGSSDLIFRAFRYWLSSQSRVLILDPTYGEYAHVLEQVIGCRVDRLCLKRENGYRINPGELASRCANACYDLVVLVNPNSPTGQFVRASDLKKLLSAARAGRFWIDETYIDYAGNGQSLESFAAASPNVVVCKSMSKVYGLSGLRAAYLCGSAAVINELRAITPPWVVSLPAQVAAVAALQDPGYYKARHWETHCLRRQLQQELAGLPGVEVIPGAANFLLCHLPADGPPAETVVARCRERGLFLRDASTMGRQLGKHALRFAVKDAETNRRIVEIVAQVLKEAASRASAG